MALKRQMLATNDHKLQDELVTETSYCLVYVVDVSWVLFVLSDKKNTIFAFTPETNEIQNENKTLLDIFWNLWL